MSASFALRLSDHQTTCTEQGDPDTPALVLIHSALLDRRMWAETARSLEGFRVITYDMRGHGDASGVPADIDQLADDLAEILDRLELAQIYVAGVSLGGAVAQRFAARWPGRTRRLMLVATAVRFPAEPLIARAASLGLIGRAAAMDVTLERWFGHDSLGADLDAVRYARGLLVGVSPKLWEAVWRALAGFDMTVEASRIRLPVLAVAGGRDASTPPHAVRDLAAAYPLGEYAEIPDAAHLVPLERPTALGEILRSFLIRSTPNG